MEDIGREYVTIKPIRAYGPAQTRVVSLDKSWGLNVGDIVEVKVILRQRAYNDNDGAEDKERA